MKEWQKRLLCAFFPRRCIYCGEVTLPDAVSCEKCADAIPRMDDPTCSHCGRTKTLCICKQHSRFYDTCVTAMRYEDGAVKAVLSLKKSDRADVIETMAQEMVTAVRRRTDAAAFDMVVCVPMRPAEYKARGFNQSELLAKEVADLLGVTFVQCLKKIYDTKPQKTLSSVARSGNLLGVFDVVGDVKDKRVLIVDDLLTTGATLHECAKMLKIHGAVNVTALAFAATVPKKDEKDDEVKDELKASPVSRVNIIAADGTLLVELS